MAYVFPMTKMVYINQIYVRVKQMVNIIPSVKIYTLEKIKWIPSLPWQAQEYLVAVDKDPYIL